MTDQLPSPAATAPPRRRRWPWILAAAVVALPLAGLLVLRAFLDPEALRPRLVAAVEDATGRRLSVGGIGLALSLRPSLELTDIALANAPGGSRPDMLTARRVEVQVAILPLLSRRLEIARIELEAPDLLLETDAQGRGNWVFTPAPRPAPATTPAPEGGGGAPLQVSLDALRVTGGRVTWRDGGTAETIAITVLEASAPLAGPTTARATLRLRETDATIQATAGAVAAFGGAAPWPLRLMVNLPGRTRAEAEGSLGPGGAWTLAVDARSATPALLAPLLPDLPIPPLRDLALAGRFAGTGADLASAEAISLRAGDSDLSVLRTGLRLNRLDIAAPRLDAPVTLALEAALGGVPIRAEGRTGSPALLLGQAQGALPVELGLAAAGAEGTIRGQLRDPRAIAGVDLALALRVPELAALAPLAGVPLPAVQDIVAQARLAERSPGFRQGAELRDITVTASAAEARGELALVVGDRPGVVGRLDIARLDLDALRTPQAAPAQPAAPAPEGGRLIPDLPLPLGALRGFDADLRLAVARLTAGGVAWESIQAPIRIEDGRARIAPFAVTTPGGAVTGEVAADAAATPTLALVLRAPRLDLAALQAAFDQPIRLSGHGELDAALRGAGTGLRQVAASLAGHLGLAMVDATVEPALLGPVQQALRARVPILPPLTLRLPVDCVAIRAEAEGGVVRFATLLVDAPAAKVAGGGTVNLGSEAIAMRLLHDVRAAGTEIRVAADLGGTLAAPAYGGVQAQNLVGALAGRLGGEAGALLGALTNRPGARPEALPECGPALTAARGGRAGAMPAPRVATAPSAPVPAAPEPPAAGSAPRPPAIPGPAGDLLRGLLRR